MSQTYYAILTAVGEAKEANAKVLNTPLRYSRMAVGDGGGSLPTPNRTQTALIGEQYRAELNSLQVDPANANQIIAELVIPETTGGWWIREMGLYDADGDLVAVANCPPSYKPQMAEGSGRTQVLRMVLIVSSTAAVQLKIDPSVVLATRWHVETVMSAHRAEADPHPQYTTEAEVSQLLAAELNKRGGKRSVRYTTTASLTLGGLAVQAGGDWSAPLAVGDRILVKDQAAARDNGIYVAAAGAWSRAADADASIEVTPGLLVPVDQGTVNGDSLWQLTTDAPITLGSTALQFEMVAGRTGAAVGTYDEVSVNARGQVVGGTRSAITSLSADATLTAAQRGLVLIDASAGARTITLPAADAALGVVDIIVRRLDNSGYRLKVQASASDMVKFHTHLSAAGYPFFVLMGAGDWWHLRSDGAGGWWPVGRCDTTPLGRPAFDTTITFPPGGYGALAGTVLNRGDWPWLWDHAQQSGMLTTDAGRGGKEGGWTSGDGAATFRGPEGRGEFLRILDESRGVDVGRAAGSSQADQFREHSHTHGFVSQNQAGSGGPYWAGLLSSSTGVAGGSETRPRNIAYPGRIKLI